MGDGDASVRLEVGRIGRPHGLHGQLTVTLTTSEAARVAPGAVLFAGDRELHVTSSSPHKHRFIVAFVGVATREEAETLVGLPLSADHADDTPDDADALWVHELIGAEVVDGEGNRCGLVESVQENPASDLLVLDTGALVPLTFVVGWVSRPDRLEIDPPAGLLEPS